MKPETLRKRLWPATLFLVMTLVAVLSWILDPGTASALQVDLTVSNEDLGVSGPYGTVSVTDTVGYVNFVVDMDSPIFVDDDNFGIQSFFFNTDLTLAASNITELLSGWSVSLDDQQADGFGKFSVEYSGTGGARQNPLTFTVTHANITGAENFYFLSEATAGNGQGHFAAHVGGFKELNGQTSAFFRDAPPSIPDPAAVFLLGSACMIGFSGVRRKFKK